MAKITPGITPPVYGNIDRTIKYNEPDFTGIGPSQEELADPVGSGNPYYGSGFLNLDRYLQTQNLDWGARQPGLRMQGDDLSRDDAIANYIIDASQRGAWSTNRHRNIIPETPVEEAPPEPEEQPSFNNDVILMPAEEPSSPAKQPRQNPRRAGEDNPTIRGRPDTTYSGRGRGVKKPEPEEDAFAGLSAYGSQKGVW